MAENTTTLILVRHGDVEGGKLLLGHTDSPLSDEGRQAVRLTAAKLASTKIDALYSSDLSRSVESASIIGEARGLPATRVSAFRELHMGEWDGLHTSEVFKTQREELDRWWRDPAGYRTPGGEGLADLHARVVPALMEVVERHRGETVCLVAHGGVNRVILFAAMGLSLSNYYTVSQDYACVNRLRYFGDGRAVVDLING